MLLSFYSRGEITIMAWVRTLKMPHLGRFEARQERDKIYIFSVLLPTLCLHGDRLEGGGDVSG
jgi:hypothetical protein